jgi:hypothetical protein
MIPNLLMASDDSRIRTQKMPIIMNMIESDATAVITEKEKSMGFFLGNNSNIQAFARRIDSMVPGHKNGADRHIIPIRPLSVKQSAAI